ncbi:MAG: ATP-dependent DNA helicase RecG [Pirellulales bacterium]|nr:ATP-dependent DNA helicase RecG [Pirellulales bacterium]
MPTSPPTPAQLLATPVQYLKGVGPERAELLHKLGLKTAADVLFHFPREYQDFTDQREMNQLEEGKLQSVRGVIEDIDFRPTSSGGSVLGVLVRGAAGYLRALWFNQPYQREKFSLGQRVLLSGKPKYEGLVWQMAHPRVETLAEEEEEPKTKILPVYPLTEGVQQWHLRKIVRQALEGYVDLLDEVFPPEYLETHDLWPIRRALPEIHFPASQENLEHARRRFVYQELFLLQLALAVKRRRQHDQRQAPRLEATAKIDARIRRLFPFELTPGQENAIAEIRADMAGPRPMNRLLQGDVGSGKTIVAVYALLLAVAHGYQAVLMAPTEVLARQHAQTIEKILAASQVRRVQLIGGMPSEKRAALVNLIAEGQADVVVGTQAIIQEDVAFAKLGLVVIDEQHKFGVRQRAVLKGQAGRVEGRESRVENKDQTSNPRPSTLDSRPSPLALRPSTFDSILDPHYLVMTATPIPRTVALTLFGDLDVSTLRDAPPGRQTVHTYLAGDAQRAKWWDFFRRKLREGRQGYVVTPLVEESDRTAAVSVEETFEALANGELADFRLGLIHGRMTAEEKDAVMENFRRGEIQVLVSTSVVEVGVDVPNATLMTIESGQRFGLAQLHQLRGRIHRGRYPGFCCVFGEPKTEESQERLKAFISTTDGFALAETDFRLRGPGELFGTRQHGLPPLRIADLLLDGEVLEEARRDAQALVAADPGLSCPEHALLRRRMAHLYGQVLELGDVG